MGKEKVLLLGAGGQVGTELVLALREAYGEDNVIASDIHPPSEILSDGPFEILNVLDNKAVAALVSSQKVTHLYHLAAMLSATAEQKPALGWELNMGSLLGVLDIAVTYKDTLKQVYWPSSIAAFGLHTPRENTPQYTVTDPNTVYGISKLAGELWCDWYHRKHNLDIRSLRYPGLISYKSPPGGGTTDYAIHIFHDALKKGAYTSFLGPDTALPMMYMSDAIRATLELMNAPAQDLSIHTSYNLAGISFTPAQLGEEIKRHLPNFQLDYAPDFRQAIADSWPASIDDSVARNDWGWKHDYDLQKLTDVMLQGIRGILEVQSN